MTRISQLGRTLPLFIFLLPIFFVLHGARENFGFVPFIPALLLTTIYLVAAALILGVCRLILRNWRQAALLTFLLFSFYFFFGSLHDWLKGQFPGSFISKYSYILPGAALAFILVFLLLRIKRPRLNRATLYLNVLLLVFVIAEVILISIKSFEKKPGGNLPAGFQHCKDCPRPDVYVIIADEYAGNTELKELFGFDNQAFIDQLAQRGFHTLPASFSNYNYTPFSIASALNMQYLELADTNRSRRDLIYSYEMIRNNRLMRFLEFHGYKFYNYSYFHFEGQPPRIREGFLPASTRLITGQTLLSRVNRDLRFNLVTRFRSSKELKKLTYGHREHIRDLLELTRNTAAEKGTAPKFVLTHLMMPHYPYYYDSTGKERKFEELVEGQQVNKANYISYLVNCNTRFLELVDHILATAKTPPIIVLMGDHGFRHFTEKVKREYHFLNHVSIHFPGNNYSAFKDSMSLVNVFRTLLNSTYRQELTALPDSSIYLRD